MQYFQHLQIILLMTRELAGWAHCYARVNAAATLTALTLSETSICGQEDPVGVNFLLCG